jgi:hypothetical protein
VHEVAGLDHEDAVPDAFGDDERLTGFERRGGLGTDRLLVAVVEHDVDATRDQVEQLVAVGV